MTTTREHYSTIYRGGESIGDVYYQGGNWRSVLDGDASHHGRATLSDAMGRLLDRWERELRKGER